MKAVYVHVHDHVHVKVDVHERKNRSIRIYGWFGRGYCYPIQSKLSARLPLSFLLIVNRQSSIVNILALCGVRGDKRHRYRVGCTDREAMG